MGQTGNSYPDQHRHSAAWLAWEASANRKSGPDDWSLHQMKNGLQERQFWTERAKKTIVDGRIVDSLR